MQHAADLDHELVGQAGLGDERVAPSQPRALGRAGEGVARQRDDGDALVRSSFFS